MLRNFFGQTSGTKRGTRGSGAKGQVFTLLSTSINGSNITLAAGPGRSRRPTYGFKHTFEEESRTGQSLVMGKAGTNSGRLHNIVAITMKVCERLEPD